MLNFQNFRTAYGDLHPLFRVAKLASMAHTPIQIITIPGESLIGASCECVVNMATA